MHGRPPRDLPAADFGGLNIDKHRTSFNATDACIPPCGNVAEMTSGACHGQYSAGSVLLRTRFALCLRGDIPTSPRPYDAMRCGAIPLMVSDNIARMGLPFQCLVPWPLLMVQVPEAAFLRDASQALKAAVRDLPPKAETRMRHLVLHFGKDLLWRHPQSRVAENFLITARRWRKRENPLTECCPMRDEVALEVKDYKT